jgi:alpha-tubulin suppressor-like RCC1 family protein
MRYSILLIAFVVAGCFKEDAGTTVSGGCPNGEPCSASPVAVTGGHQFTKIAAGRYHTCGVKSNGEVWCWGLNSVGQLGAASQSFSSNVPLKVSGTQTFVSVSVGDFHTCALASDAGVYCWGNNNTDVLGTTTTESCGTITCSRSPIRSAGTTTFLGVAAGAAHTCALDSNSAALCWGYNVLGEIGSTTYATSTSSPVTVPGGKTYTSIVAGYRFSCGLDTAQALYCWGYGDDGELGTLAVSSCIYGSASYLCSATPIAAGTSEKFTQIAAGTAFGCGLASTSNVLCWGYGRDGEIGNGALQNAGTPIAIKLAGPWSSVATGSFHACALRASGAAYCWGLNNYAQLGDGSKVYANPEPQAVTGGKSFTQIVAGANHTCGLLADGSVWCWGSDGAGQLGRG